MVYPLILNKLQHNFKISISKINYLIITASGCLIQHDGHDLPKFSSQKQFPLGFLV